MLPLGSVAVIAMNSAVTAKVTENVASPLPSIVTVVEPRTTWPSPNPDESRAAFEKNSIVNAVFAVLFSRAETVVLPPDGDSEIRAG